MTTKKRIKVDIKIKLNQILRETMENKYSKKIYNNQTIEY